MMHLNQINNHGVTTQHGTQRDMLLSRRISLSRFCEVKTINNLYRYAPHAR